MTKDDREIVSALRANLAEKVGKDEYEVWFGPTTQLCVGPGHLTVVVPNRFYQDWLRNNFRKDLEAACLETLGQALLLEFRIDEALAAQTRCEPPSSAAAIDSAFADPSAGPQSEGSEDEDRACDAAAPAGAGLTVKLRGAGTGGRAAGRVPLRNGRHFAAACRTGGEAAHPAHGAAATVAAAPTRRRFANLGSFVLGASNRLAFTTAQMTLARPGSVSPLLVYGPHGVGKTHLLEGIWSAFRQARRQSAAIYLSAEQFTSYFLEALRGSGLPSFRRKYRDVELLILDDMQFFAGKRATLTELLHTIDTLTGAGRQLVFAADRSPAALKALGPEIIARLAGAVACRIEPPEYTTRLAIVNQLAAQREMILPADVQAYVASHLTSQARELAGAEAAGSDELVLGQADHLGLGRGSVG